MTDKTATKPSGACYGGPPYATQAFPGEPIYLRFGKDEPLLISDSAALFLAHQLVQFVLGNLQSKARAK